MYVVAWIHMKWITSKAPILIPLGMHVVRCRRRHLVRFVVSLRRKMGQAHGNNRCNTIALTFKSFHKYRQYILCTSMVGAWKRSELSGSCHTA